MSFSPLAGCGLFQHSNVLGVAIGKFQSPCGVWVVSERTLNYVIIKQVSVPLRGVGCFEKATGSPSKKGLFQSPCGVWVVSIKSRELYGNNFIKEFQSPCGVWVVSLLMEKIINTLFGLFQSPCGV